MESYTEIKKHKINDTILMIMLFINLISYLFSGLYNLFTKVSIIINTLFVCTIFLLNIDNFKKDKKRIAIVYLIQILILLLTYFIKRTGIGSILHMLVITSILIVSPKIDISNKVEKILKYLIPIYYLFFVITSKEHLNTNYVGYIFLCLFIISISVYNLHNKGNFFKLILFLLLTLLLTYSYRCRTAMLACIILFIMLLIPKRVYTKKSLKVGIPIVLIFGSLIFAFLYVSLWKSGFYINITFFAGKSLYSGRNSLWYEAFQLIINNPLLGVGSKYVLKSLPAYALHNTVLMITVTFGIPNLMLYFYNFTNFIKEVYKKAILNNYFRVVISSIFVLFFVDFFESYTYWSNYNYLLFFVIVLILNKNNNYNQKNNCNLKKVYIFEEGIDRMGGVERVISTLANNLVDSYDVTMISFYKTRENCFFKYNNKVNIEYLTNQFNKKSDKYKNKTIKYYFWRVLEKTKDYVFLNDKISEKINEITNNDVVICGRTDVALKVISFLDSYKKLIVRDAIHYKYQKKSIQNKIIKLFPNKVNTFIVSSEESKNIYLDHFPKKSIKIVKIYNPLGIKPIVKYNYEHKEIIAIGRYSSQKGYENLLNAFKIVNEEKEEWKLKILGSNDKKLQSLINSLELNDCVNLVSGKNDVVPELNNASIFVMTSRYEGYANALVEAMACGVPSITYNWYCGADDIITNGRDGIIVPLCNREDYASGNNNIVDAENLAKEILKLINNKELCDKFSKNAAKKINDTRKTDVIINYWKKEIQEDV